MLNPLKLSLINLPSVPTDTEIATSCNTGESQSKFVVTGRGGLPSNPSEVLTTDAVIVNLITLEANKNNYSSDITTTKANIPSQIVEATGWKLNKKGEVVLTTTPTVSVNNRWLTAALCDAS